MLLIITSVYSDTISLIDNDIIIRVLRYALEEPML